MFSRIRAKMDNVAAALPNTPPRPATPGVTKLALVAMLAGTGVAVAVFATRRSGGAVAPGFAAPFLWLFSSLFLVRVGGQLLVRLRRPVWLPPTEQWNLTPYRLLLPTQVAILALMAWINIAFSLGHGPPLRLGPRLGEGVLVFAYVYASAMAIRYVIRMAGQPQERWFGGTIPIVFHWVIAAYLYVLGSFYASH